MVDVPVVAELPVAAVVEPDGLAEADPSILVVENGAVVVGSADSAPPVPTLSVESSSIGCTVG